MVKKKWNEIKETIIICTAGLLGTIIAGAPIIGDLVNLLFDMNKEDDIDK